jgi:geranylgeranyl diphosphate synthase, type I
MGAQQLCLQILETYGGKTADKASSLLLQDPALKELEPIFEFISKNWRDPLRPAMIKLGCEAVGGEPAGAEEAALAMSLMNLSYYLWDDIIDEAPSRIFKPTLYGKFGKGPALIAGGLASAKAFTILNQAKIEEQKRQAVTDLFWGMWAKMAEAEIMSLKARSEEYTVKDKLSKIETEVDASLAICLRLGAVMGNGSEREKQHLGRYGQCVGVIFDLQYDFSVSVNQTLELVDKIRTGALPYALLWAKEHSPQFRRDLENIVSRRTYGPEEVEKVVRGMLAANALNETYQIIEELAGKAVETIEEMEKSSALKALQTFALLQPQRFKESLRLDAL